MVETIEKYDQEQRQLAQEAMRKYAEYCKKLNLNETSAAALLGVSRQSWVNYRAEKTVPSAGVLPRMRIVLELLTEAKSNGLLPADGRRNQGGLVNKILSRQ
jgi:DNA-binding XRE family transcriptional regulator